MVDIEPSTVPENVKLHEDPRTLTLENQAIRDFEAKYKQYMDNNADFGKALSSNDKHAKMTLHGLDKMPTISPHVYSLLGPSHELRIRQALAESVTRKKFARDSMELNGFDGNSLSFHLDDDDDLATNASNRNWVTRSTGSPSKRSTIGSSFKLDHGITMLKWGKRNPDVLKDLVTIKSSFIRTMKEVPSKTSSTKSPFRGMFDNRSSFNSLLSLNPELASRKFRKRIYLNTSIESVELEKKDHATVPILVNFQVQALVQTVFDVLERVNPEKSRIIVEIARDTDEIKQMLLRPEVQQFVQSLLGQSLLSSPESFVVSVATVADEIDFKFEGILEKEIVALTLEMPALPCLDALIAEIRNNIFRDTKKRPRHNEGPKEASSADEQTVDVAAGAKKKSLKRDRKLSDEKVKCCGVKVLKQVDKLKKNVVDEKQSSVDKIEDQSKEDIAQPSGSISGHSANNSKTKTDEQRGVSGNVPAKRTSNSKVSFPREQKKEDRILANAFRFP